MRLNGPQPKNMSSPKLNPAFTFTANNTAQAHNRLALPFGRWAVQIVGQVQTPCST